MQKQNARVKQSMSESDVFDKNSALNDTGIFQAMKMREYFKFNCVLDAIYCSSALRSFKTAELIFEYMESSTSNLHLDDRFNKD